MSEDDLPPLSDVQHEVMTVVWDLGKCPASDVWKILEERRGISRNTVHTLLVRLEEKGWLKSVFPYQSLALEPKIWNTFTRLTLVSKRLNERVTLDIDLTFYTGAQDLHLGELAIAEVKMDAAHGGSAFLEQMRLQKIHSHGFSKYCIGVSMLVDQVKKNALKPKLLWIDRLTRGA